MKRIAHVVALLLLATPLIAQNAEQLAQEELSVPDTNNAAVRDLVERYEELRQVLREQIQISSELYTPAEVEQLTRDLTERLAETERVLALVRRDFKAIYVQLKDERKRNVELKGERAKILREHATEVATLRATLDSVEEERLFGIGTGFSPAGSLSAIAMFNVPGSGIGLFTEIDYSLREQETTTFVGVSWSFLSQRTVIESSQRLRARSAARRAAEADALPAEGEGDGVTTRRGTVPSVESESSSGSIIPDSSPEEDEERLTWRERRAARRAAREAERDAEGGERASDSLAQ